MSKSLLRQQYLQKRLALSDSERSKLDDLLLINFQQFEMPDQLQYLLSFWPLIEKGEPNSFLLTDFLAFRNPGLQLAYPVTDYQNLSLTAMLVNDETAFVMGKNGIAEPAGGQFLDPAELDLVLVPLLAFDSNGFRLGYGKGFYDRFLPQCKPGCQFVGISHFPPERALPGVDEFDVPLTACITPEMIYEF